MRPDDLRLALLAGQWYPRDAEACRAFIEAHEAQKTSGGKLTGLIAPHAGWAFSGKAAARGFATLAQNAGPVDLVVLYGAHRAAREASTIFCGAAWQTPLGDLCVAHTLADDLARKLDLACEPVSPARPDNAAELLMPFARHYFPEAELLMLGVAATPAALEIGRAVGADVRAFGRRAVFIGSTDLTHYGPSYGFTPRGGGRDAERFVREHNDREYIEHILAHRPEAAFAHAAANASACCPAAVAAAMATAEAYGHELAPLLIDHYLSCDVLPAESFVGYASIVF